MERNRHHYNSWLAYFGGKGVIFIRVLRCYGAFFHYKSENCPINTKTLCLDLGFIDCRQNWCWSTLQCICALEWEGLYAINHSTHSKLNLKWKFSTFVWLWLLVDLVFHILVFTMPISFPLLQMIKYGVVSMEYLVQDILLWKSLYISGRLQKPVCCVSYSTWHKSIFIDWILTWTSSVFFRLNNMWCPGMGNFTHLFIL